MVTQAPLFDLFIIVITFTVLGFSIKSHLLKWLLQPAYELTNHVRPKCRQSIVAKPPCHTWKPSCRFINWLDAAVLLTQSLLSTQGGRSKVQKVSKQAPLGAIVVNEAIRDYATDFKAFKDGKA